MNFLQIIILAAVQGAAELLPVSSSAHVIVAEKLMGIDPTSPAMTLLLVMLHTGTMVAVIFYFWKSWKESFFSSREVFLKSARLLALATVLTGVAGLSLKYVIEKFALGKVPHAQIELLFGNMTLIAAALAAVGMLIIFTGLLSRRSPGKKTLETAGSLWIGAVQGVCLPFRGFSRSGATISTGLLLGIGRKKAEEFSFALAVVLTPPVIAREVWRLLRSQHSSLYSIAKMTGLFYPSLLGMVFSFLAGILALRWLSRWLEGGRWYLFGIYCLCASAVVFLLHRSGF